LWQIELQEPASFVDRVKLPGDDDAGGGGGGDSNTDGPSNSGVLDEADSEFQKRIAACVQAQETAYAQWFDSNRKVQEEVAVLINMGKKLQAQGFKGQLGFGDDIPVLQAEKEETLSERREIVAKLGVKDLKLKDLKLRLLRERLQYAEAGEQEEEVSEDWEVAAATSSSGPLLEKGAKQAPVPTYNWCFCYEMPDLDEYLSSDYEPIDPDSSEHLWWERARFIERGVTLNTASGILVILNTLFIGFEVDHTGGHWFISSMSKIFLFVFFIEQSIRAICLGKMFLQSPINCIDFSIILLSILSYILKAAEIKNWLSENPSLLTLVRLLRLLRMARVFSHFRSDSMFKSLGTVVQAFGAAMASTWGTFLFLTVVLYIFALIGRSWIGLSPDFKDYDMPDVGTVHTYFGTVPRSIVTMFQILSQDGWSDLSRGLVAKSPITYVFMVLWIMVGNMGVLNLLTAIFVDKLLELKSEREKEEKALDYKKTVKATTDIVKVFEAIDKDHSGKLSREEMLECVDVLHDKKYEAVFTALSMDSTTFSKILDWIVVTTPSTTEDEEDSDEEDGLDYNMFIDRFLEMGEEKIAAEQWRLHTEIAKVRLGAESAIALVHQLASEPFTSYSARSTAVQQHSWTDQERLYLKERMGMEQVKIFLSHKCGFLSNLSERIDAFERHGVKGEILGILNDDDLNELGIQQVGEKTEFYNELKKEVETMARANAHRRA